MILILSRLHCLWRDQIRCLCFHGGERWRLRCLLNPYCLRLLFLISDGRLVCVHLVKLLPNPLVLHSSLHHGFVVAAVLRPIELVRICLWLLDLMRQSRQLLWSFAAVQLKLLGVVHVVAKHTFLRFLFICVAIVQVQWAPASVLLRDFTRQGLVLRQWIKQAHTYIKRF